MEAVASVKQMTTMRKKYYYSEYYYLNAIYQFAAYDQILMYPAQCRDVFSCFLEYFVKESKNIKAKEEIKPEDVKNIESFNKFVEETGTFQFVFALSKVNNATFNIEKVLKLINLLEQVYNLKPTVVEEIELTIDDDDSVWTGTKITADRFSKRTVGYLVTADAWFIQYVHRLSLLTLLFRETCLLFEKDSFEYDDIKKTFLEYFKNKCGYDAHVEMSDKIVKLFSGVEDVKKPVLVDKNFNIPAYKGISDLGICGVLK